MKVRVKVLKWLCVAGLATALAVGLARTTRADDAPKPDPAGTATGDRTTVVDAGGNALVLTEPAKLSDDDAKDPAKKKAYDDALKAYTDYKAAADKEPLAGTIQLIPCFGVISLG